MYGGYVAETTHMSYIFGMPGVCAEAGAEADGRHPRNEYTTCHIGVIIIMAIGRSAYTR